ncbi:MAG TPA: hypothetical protein VJ917_06755 [Saprospiraceae bacterium]|nr:hypothetical protein [Saprospiraceae bacterium]
MSFFLFMWVALFAAFAGIGAAIKGSKPSKRRMRNDIDSIRQDMKEEARDLVPWKKEEIELFSLNQSDKKRRRGWSSSSSGFFTNIYHEKVLLYYLKEYGAKGRNSVVFARNSQNEYIYNVSKKGAEIYIDEFYLGFLDNEGQLFDTKKREQVAHVDKETGLSRRLVRTGEKTLGAILTKEDEESKVKQRAFEIMQMDTEKDRQIFLAIGFFLLILREVN